MRAVRACVCVCVFVGVGGRISVWLVNRENIVLLRL